MRKFFAVFVVMAGMLAACVGNSAQPIGIVASPKEASSPVAPTSMPTTVPTPTLEPTAVPTEVPTETPTPTATPEPSAWEIADQMLSECVEEVHWGKSTWDRYERQLRDQMLAAHPEWETRRYVRNYGTGRLFSQDGKEWSWDVETNTGVKGEYPNPFSFADLPARGFDTGFSSEECAMYILVFEKVLENRDGDGIIVGEAYLFYEVGGQDPHLFDGELKELHFTLPPLSEQEEFLRRRALEEAAEKAVAEIALRDCLRVATMLIGPVAEERLKELNSWATEYFDFLLLAEGLSAEQVLGVYHPPEFVPSEFPPPTWPQCFVMLYYDNANGEAFLIYETKDEVVKVPFLAPLPPDYPSEQPAPDPTDPTQCVLPTGMLLNEADPMLIYAEPTTSSSVVGELSPQEFWGPNLGESDLVCQNGYVWWKVQLEGTEIVGWVWSEPYP